MARPELDNGVAGLNCPALLQTNDMPREMQVQVLTLFRISVFGSLNTAFCYEYPDINSRKNAFAPMARSRFKQKRNKKNLLKRFNA